MHDEVDRLAKYHAKLLQYIDEDTEDDLWKRNSLWTHSVKEIFDHSHTMWTGLLMEIVQQGFVKANEFSDSENNDIIMMCQNVMSNKGTNANKFWAPFVKENCKLI